MHGPVPCGHAAATAGPYLKSPRLLVTRSAGQYDAEVSSTTISTFLLTLPCEVETAHSHSPLAETWMLERISSLRGRGDVPKCPTHGARHPRTPTPLPAVPPSSLS